MKRGTIYSATDSNSKRGRKEITAKIYSFSQYYRFQLIIKRGWISKKNRKRKGKGKLSHIIKTHEYSGPSFSNLPRDILSNILFRLPVKTILVSKIVCKTWYELISDHEFAKLHYDQGEAYPLIDSSASRMIYFMQPDKTDFDLKLGMSCDHSSFKPGCVCNVEVELDTVFEIPDRTKKNERYVIVNSCNGLHCLESDNDPTIVCNPITGEFINLPVLPGKQKYYSFWYVFGFGFSPASNQYKVIRISERHRTELHIIGTKTWKQIGYCIESIPKSFPIYLNGFLYWSAAEQPLSLISFDIASECFELVLGPTTDESCISDSDNMGVLGGELCISAVLKSGVIHVWTMKDYGNEKAGWSKVFSFILNSFQIQNCGSYQPIKYLDDGALLMIHYYTNDFIYMDPKTNRIRYMTVCGTDIDSLFAHIPSFVSLKHALSGLNVKVLNVKSRFAELKLQGKSEDIYLVEGF